MKDIIKSENDNVVKRENQVVTHISDKEHMTERTKNQHKKDNSKMGQRFGLTFYRWGNPIDLQTGQKEFSFVSNQANDN